MLEPLANNNDPYDKMIEEAKRLALEALLAGLDEDLTIARINLELNSIRAQLKEKPTVLAS